jgi:transcriptional regulator with XRE-family HTH domain
MTSKQIKALREALDLTQQKLADTIAATQVTVARWETGISRPTGAYLKALKDLAVTARNTKNTKIKREQINSTLPRKRAVNRNQKTSKMRKRTRQRGI